MIIQGKHLTLIYDKDKENQTYALDEINVSIEKNKITGITGPSGSGKSSLLYILSGIIKPTRGEVYYQEKNLCSLKKDEIALIRKKEFGFIFQRHFLIDYLTALDNVLVGVNSNKTKEKEIALDLLEKLGLKECVSKKPYQMSVGQRQRISIARAFINEPKVVFADEPTASLDYSSTNQVLELMRAYQKKGTTVIMVTHDNKILEQLDNVIEMGDARIIEKQ